MKTPLVYALILFILGFVLINGHHNFLSVVFAGMLLTIFILVPLFIRIRHFIREISRHTSLNRKQWA